MHEITATCIMYPPWKTAKIPLLSIGQGNETGFAQLLCGHTESEDSTFCAKLTYNIMLCLGAGGRGRQRGKSAFVLCIDLTQNQLVSSDHKNKCWGRVWGLIREGNGEFGASHCKPAGKEVDHMLFTVSQNGSGEAAGFTEIYFDTLTRHNMQWNKK